MIVGETVGVRFPVAGEEDEGGNPVVTFTEPTNVDNVLVAPGSTTDVTETNRPDGVEVIFALHFPKTFTQSLRGAHVVVRGEELAVVGDPQSFTDENTPGDWNRPVDVTRTEG